MAGNANSQAAMALYDHQPPGMPPGAIDVGGAALDEGKPKKGKKGGRRKKRKDKNQDGVFNIDDQSAAQAMYDDNMGN